MKILDLYCKAGGASVGLARAGHEVVGVDIELQPNYPYEFHQGDALAYPLNGFDAYWASPPCQKYCKLREARWKDREHPDLIGLTRDRLAATGKPYIIENVPGARGLLRDPIMLCGSMFGLELEDGSQLRRHRYFEVSGLSILTSSCQHNGHRSVGVWGHPGGTSKRDGRMFSTEEWQEVMDIDWMTSAEMAEAVPPAYGEYIGRWLAELKQHSQPERLYMRC